MNKEKLVKYIIIIISVLLVAVLGGMFTNIGMPWYETLTKPIQWPPKILFPVLWSFVYICSAVVLIMLVKNNNQSTKNVCIPFIINGLLNVLWCLVFFVFQQLFWGQVIILLNLIMAFVLLIRLKEAGNFYFYLLIVYPIWLSIATTLNLASWILN